MEVFRGRRMGGEWEENGRSKVGEWFGTGRRPGRSKGWINLLAAGRAGGVRACGPRSENSAQAIYFQ